MLVSENNIFKPDVMVINIIESDGATWVTEVQRTMTVDKIKLLALTHITSHHNLNSFNASSSPSSSGTSLLFKVIHAQSGKVLNDNSASLAQEGVFDGDELIMVKERLPTLTTLQEISVKTITDAPGKDEIAVVTQGLTPVHQDNNKSSVGSPPLDFQSELPRILVSLIESAQRILCLSKEANELFDMQSQLEAEMKKTDETNSNTASEASSLAEDESLVDQLKEMGFPEGLTRQALRRTRNDSISAMDWLLENEKEAAEASPVYEETSSPVSSLDSSPCAEAGCHIAEVTTGETDDAYVDEETEEKAVSAPQEGSPTTTIATFRSVPEILELYRLYKRKTFNPNPRALQTLVEMGFQESEVQDALRLHNNNQNAACDWLLGDRSNRLSSNPESFQGLDRDSSLYEAIMTNPIVQMGLNNTRCLHAFLSMLENPTTTTHYLNDTEVGPVLLQVSRIYHAEKHGIAPPLGSTAAGRSHGVPHPHSHHHHHHVHHTSPAISTAHLYHQHPARTPSTSQPSHHHHHHHHSGHGHFHGGHGHSHGGHGHSHQSHGHSHVVNTSNPSSGNGCLTHGSGHRGFHHHHHHGCTHDEGSGSDTPTGTGSTTPTGVEPNIAATPETQNQTHINSAEPEAADDQNNPLEVNRNG